MSFSGKRLEKSSSCFARQILAYASLTFCTKFATELYCLRVLVSWVWNFEDRLETHQKLKRDALMSLSKCGAAFQI